jgi:capsular polysaccharide biosynthesis protein
MMHTEPRAGISIEVAEGEYVFSLRDFLQVIWRRASIVALVVALLTGAAVAFSLLQTPTYEASTKILVGQKSQGDAPINLAGDVQGLQQITQTVVEAVGSRVVAEEVIERLDLRVDPETFLENLNVQQVAETQFIQVDYRDADPRQARDIANAIAEVSSDRISEVSPNAAAITATIWEPSTEPDVPVDPKPVRNGVLALVFGLVIGVGLAFLLEYLDDSWRSPEEAERLSGAPTFGVIPKFKAPKGKNREELLR